MAKFKTSVKFWGGLVVLAGGAGLLAKRSWGTFREKWRFARKKKALTDELEKIMREKVRLEGELEEMEDPESQPDNGEGEKPARGDCE